MGRTKGSRALAATRPLTPPYWGLRSQCYSAIMAYPDGKGVVDGDTAAAAAAALPRCGGSGGAGEAKEGCLLMRESDSRPA